MSLKLEHPPLLVKRVEQIIARLLAEYPAVSGPNQAGRTVKDMNAKQRDAACREMTGMAFGYLKDIANPLSAIREPSGRVMKNLGMEIWVKDKASGEMEQVEFFGRCQIDFTDPQNPKSLD